MSTGQAKRRFCFVFWGGAMKRRCMILYAQPRLTFITIRKSNDSIRWRRCNGVDGFIEVMAITVQSVFLIRFEEYT